MPSRARPGDGPLPDPAAGLRGDWDAAVRLGRLAVASRVQVASRGDLSQSRCRPWRSVRPPTPGSSRPPQAADVLIASRRRRRPRRGVLDFTGTTVSDGQVAAGRARPHRRQHGLRCWRHRLHDGSRPPPLGPPLLVLDDVLVSSRTSPRTSPPVLTPDAPPSSPLSVRHERPSPPLPTSWGWSSGLVSGQRELGHQAPLSMTVAPCTCFMTVLQLRVSGAAADRCAPAEARRRGTSRGRCGDIADWAMPSSRAGGGAAPQLPQAAVDALRRLRRARLRGDRPGSRLAEASSSSTTPAPPDPPRYAPLFCARVAGRSPPRPLVPPSLSALTRDRVGSMSRAARCIDAAAAAEVLAHVHPS